MAVQDRPTLLEDYSYEDLAPLDEEGDLKSWEELGFYTRRELQYLPLEVIDYHIRDNDSKYDNLAVHPERNIRVAGCSPIIVYPDSKRPGVFQIEQGHHRCTALKALGFAFAPAWVPVPCYECPVAPHRLQHVEDLLLTSKLVDRLRPLLLPWPSGIQYRKKETSTSVTLYFVSDEHTLEVVLPSPLPPFSAHLKWGLGLLEEAKLVKETRIDADTEEELANQINAWVDGK
jgi:hypothetical protein